MFDRTTKWLETKWVTPAYAGWLLMALTICFFGVATNTMAGWLYVLSGVGIALLGVAAILPARSLQSLTIDRQPVQPVTAGAELEITVTIQNPTDRVLSLFQVQDLAPFRPKHPPIAAVDRIAPRSEYQWVYRQPTERRGVYEWERLALRSGAPIGLFWCQRERQARAIAYVYPQVLELSQCPLIEGMGSSEFSTNRPTSSRYLAMANEGVTRALRPYRYGDSMRMIHWRTSARRGEFQVRELEIDRGGQEIVICLDNNSPWSDSEDFEQAVIAACSLYFYANKFPNLNVKLWTAGTGLISGDRRVLETLAEVQIDESINTELPSTSLVYLTSQPQGADALPPGSRWVLWSRESFVPSTKFPGIVIDPTKSLQKQLSNSNFATVGGAANAGSGTVVPDLKSPVNNQNAYLN
jgi:uncharacterized protein (DUF58 family)